MARYPTQTDMDETARLIFMEDDAISFSQFLRAMRQAHSDLAPDRLDIEDVQFFWARYMGGSGFKKPTRDYMTGKAL